MDPGVLFDELLLQNGQCNFLAFKHNFGTKGRLSIYVCISSHRGLFHGSYVFKTMSRFAFSHCLISQNMV